MKSQLQPLDPASLVEYTSDNPSVFVSEEIALLRSIQTVLHTIIPSMSRTPQYIEQGRVVLVKRGVATFNINLISHALKEGDVLLIPEHNYIQIEAFSDDLDGEILSFQHTPLISDRCLHFHPSEKDFGRFCHYCQLMWEVCQTGCRKIVEHIRRALLLDIQNIYNTERSSLGVNSITGSEAIFQRFLATYRDADLPRNVKAYADYLCVSPNHLSAVVRKESGRTVMDWLNDYCLLQAKVMLTNTDLPVYLIGEKLGFASATQFTRFFVREAGLTPTSFRRDMRR